MVIEITEKFRHLRAEKGWNRSEVARQADLPISTYQAYEKLNRKPKGEAAIKIARAFGVTLDYLLDDERGYPPGPLDRVSYVRSRKVLPDAQALDLSTLPENFKNYFQSNPDKLRGLTQRDIDELASIRGYGGEPRDPEYWVNKHLEENLALEKCKQVLLGSNREVLISLLDAFSKQSQ
jgi:transcriptional regulator with XRE-family HTH domain